MAIVTEYFKTRDDGVVLNRTYSNLDVMIERDGVRYSEAIDPVGMNRQYIETDEHIDMVATEKYSSSVAWNAENKEGGC